MSCYRLLDTLCHGCNEPCGLVDFSASPNLNVPLRDSNPHLPPVYVGLLLPLELSGGRHMISVARDDPTYGP